MQPPGHQPVHRRRHHVDDRQHPGLVLGSRYGVGNPDHGRLGERDACELGLAALDLAAVPPEPRSPAEDRPLGAAGAQALLAPHAMTAARTDRDEHPITGPEAAHLGPDFDHGAQELVAKPGPRLEAECRAGVEDVQIRAADPGHRDLHHRVGRQQDRRIRDVLDRYHSVALKRQSAHTILRPRVVGVSPGRRARARRRRRAPARSRTVRTRRRRRSPRRTASRRRSL